MSILLRSYHCQFIDQQDFVAIDLHCSLSILEGIGEIFCRITLLNFATFFNVEKSLSYEVIRGGGGVMIRAYPYNS